MAEKIPDQIRRIDKLDKKVNSKISVVEGKENELTEAYIAKTEDILQKLHALPENDQERLKIEAAMFQFLSKIDEKNVLAKKAAYLSGVDAALERIMIARETRDVFEEKIYGEILRPAGVNPPIEDIIRVYLNRPDNQKTPLDKILAGFQTLQPFLQLTPHAPKIVAAYSREISVALIFHVNGNADQAGEILGLIINEIETYAEAEKTAENLEKERSKLIPFEKAYEQAAKEFLFQLKRQKYSSQEYRMADEKYAMTLRDMIGGMGSMNKITDAFMSSGGLFDAQREAIFMEVAGDSPNFQYKLFLPRVEGEEYVLDEQIGKIPLTKDEYEEIKLNAENALLFTRRDLYLRTGLSEYKSAFDESQKMLTDKADKDSRESLDDAAEEDKQSELVNTENRQEYDRLKEDVNDYVSNVVQEFDRIQKLQVSDPVAATKALVKFRIKIDSDAAILAKFKPFFAKEGEGSVIIDAIGKKTAHAEMRSIQQVFYDVGKFPALRNTLLAIFEKYTEQADILAVEIVENNPQYLKFQDTFGDFFKYHGQPFAQSISTLFKQVEDANKNGSDNDSEDQGLFDRLADEDNTEMPSETLVQRWIHQGALDTLIAKKTVVRGQLDYMMEAVEKNYEYLEGNFSTFPLGKKAAESFRRIKQKLKTAKEFLDQIDNVCDTALEIEGSGEGVSGFAVASLKAGGKLLVAVSGAVTASFALTASGFTATPAVAFVVTTLVSSFGATVGSGIGEGLIEGDWRTFEVENFARSWGTGAMFCGAGRMVGNAFGFVGGKSAAMLSRASSRLSASTQAYLGRYAEHLLEKSALASSRAGGGVISNLLGQIREETREEFVEDLIQKTAEGLAPKYPHLGFVLSCIPAGTRSGRMRFIKETGTITPAKGVSGIVTENGIRMVYDDVSSMRAFLESKNAPPDVLNAFNETGEVHGTFGGVGIYIKPTKEDFDMRSILGGHEGMKVKVKSGVIFNPESGSYTYFSDPEALIGLFEKNGLLAAMDDGGRIEVRNADGKLQVFERALGADPIETEVPAKPDAVFDKKIGLWRYRVEAPDPANVLKWKAGVENILSMLKSGRSLKDAIGGGSDLSPETLKHVHKFQEILDTETMDENDLKLLAIGLFIIREKGKFSNLWSNLKGIRGGTFKVEDVFEKENYTTCIDAASAVKVLAEAMGITGEIVGPGKIGHRYFRSSEGKIVDFVWWKRGGLFQTEEKFLEAVKALPLSLRLKIFHGFFTAKTDSTPAAPNRGREIQENDNPELTDLTAQQIETKRVDYGSSLLGKLLQSGDLILGRFGDIESGFLNKKLESLKRHAGIGRLTSADKARARLVSFMESDYYKFRPIHASITNDGHVEVVSNGNVRVYAAIIYDVDPEHVPVYCSGFGTSGDNVANTTLREVLDRAAVVKDTQKNAPTASDSKVAEILLEELAKTDIPKNRGPESKDLSAEQITSLSRNGVMEINDRPEVLRAVQRHIEKLKRSEKVCNTSRSMIKPYDRGFIIEHRGDNSGARKFLLYLGIQLPDDFLNENFKIVINGLTIEVRKSLRPVAGPSDSLDRDSLMGLAKSSPGIVLSHARQNSYAEEVIEAAFRHADAWDVFENLELLNFKPYAVDVIQTVVGHVADWDAGFAKEIIRAAAENSPTSALQFASEFMDKMDADVAEKIIRAAAEKNPGAALVYASAYVDKLDAGVAAEVIRTAAKETPDLALKFASEYVDKLDAGVAEEIIRAAAKRHPREALIHAGQYIDQPYGEEIVRMAAESQSVEHIMQYAAAYAFCAGDIIEEAAEKSPKTALEYAKNYIDQPYAGKIIEKAARKIAMSSKPSAVFEHLESFVNEPYAEEVIEAVCLKANAPQGDLSGLAERFHLFSAKPYAEKIIRIVAELRPDHVMEYANQFIDQTYAEQIIRQVAEKYPGIAVRYGKKYLDQLYGKNIFRQAAFQIFEKDPLVAVEVFEGWMKEFFTAEELREMTGPAVKKILDSDSNIDIYKLWSSRFNLFFTGDQMIELQEKIIKCGKSVQFAQLIENFLNADERFIVGESMARKAVEVMITSFEDKGKLVRDIENKNAEVATRERRIQGFIWGHINRVVEARKTDPVKAAEIICSLHKKNFPKKYPKEARELIDEFRGKNDELFRGLYEVIYATYTGTFVENIFVRFIDISETEGEAKAGEYIAGLNEKAKDLIGTEIPAELRASDEYMYFVKYVFPEGNYSNHDANLAMGDRTEHLDGYKFDKDGYPVALTGLLGYQFKDVRTEADAEGQASSFHDQHLALLTGYQERLSGIRDFVASRGPNNAELQKVFEAKINTLFEAHAAPEFRELSGLNTREKMLVLFVSEAARKGRSGRGFVPDGDILDLIVEYKYAYHENLENYVQRSADTVKRGRDEATQQYFLWSELSQIYGENLKHILRHDIFEELQAGENYSKIVEIFTRLIAPAEEQDLKPKQWENFENTFNNSHITPEKRFGIIYKQIVGFVSSNIKFKSASEKAEFTAELDRICQKLKEKGDFTFEDFKKIVPELFALRNRYQFDINTKLDELFSADINTILAEIAKYEPLIEEEAKETKMGGEKDKLVKKSAKHRKIRSFFMKTKESANARMGAYLCISGDGKMWENKNYFEMVMKNEESGKVVGLAMLLNIQAKDGKRYLWFGPNPFEGFLEQVSSQQTYDYMLKTVSEFAAANGYDGVVVPSQDSQILGGCTNRGGDFPDIIKASRLRDAKGRLKIVQFGEKYMLGGSYGYEDGALVWEKGKQADRAPATVMPSADQDFQDSDSLSVRVEGRPETEDYSRKEVRQAKTEELKARLARGEISRKEYGAERAQILRRAYLDLMTHIITDAENFVTENPDAKAKEITAHLIAMAKNRGLEPSTLQKDMMTIAARKYVKERKIVRKITDTLNNPDPVKARRAKIRLLKGADLSFVNPDDITILTDRPDTLTLIFAKTEDYEKAFKGGATLTEADIMRVQQSMGFFTSSKYSDQKLNGKLIFVKKPNVGTLIHEEQHSWFMRYFDYRLYLNPSDRTSQILHIIAGEGRLDAKIATLEERSLMKFPESCTTSDEKIDFVIDILTFEQIWGYLKDETIAYLKGGKFQHGEIPLIYEELKDISFKNLQFKIRLTKVFDCLKYELERLRRQRSQPEMLAQIVQTAETPNDAVMRLRALGKPGEDGQAELSEILLDLDEEETQIYRNFLQTDELAGLESSLDQRVSFLMELKVDNREIRTGQYARLKRQVLNEFPDLDLNSFLAELENMKLRPGTGRIMMWSDRVEMLQEWYKSRKEEPAALSGGIWADKLSNNQEIGVGGSIGSSELTTKLKLDFERFDSQLGEFTEENMRADFEARKQDMIDWLKATGAENADPYLIFVANRVQLKVQELLKINSSATYKEGERREKYGETPPRLSDMKDNMAMCAEQAALGQFLLQKIGFESSFVVGGTMANPKDKWDTEEKHVYLVVRSPDNPEETFIFDIARPHLPGNIARVLKTGIPFNYDLLKGKRGIFVKSRDVFKGGEDIWFGVGEVNLMREDDSNDFIEKPLSKESPPAKPTIVDHPQATTAILDRFKSAITAKYGEVSPLTPEIEAGILARYEHYEALTRQVSSLPEAYRNRAQAIIDKRKARIEKTLQELLDKRHSFGAKALTLKDGLTFKDLIEAHEKISRVEKAIGELPREFQGNLIEWLEERRQVFIGLYNGDSSLQMTTLDKNLEWIEKKRKYVMENPDMAHFALAKFGKLPSRQQMESLQPLVMRLAEFKEIFHQLEAVEALIRTYPELQVHQETLYAIKALKNIADGQVSEETMFAEGGHNLSTRITRMMDLAGRPEKLEILMKFDREIGRKLSPNQKSEITRLYFEMVIDGKLTHAAFRERVAAYGKTHENLSTLSALSPAGREQYAANAAMSLENFLVEKIVQKGLDPQVVEREIREKYAETVATAEVTININFDPLTTVLEEGKFRTYEELDVKHREEGMFGKTGYGERRAARDRQVGQGSGFVVGALSCQNGFDEVIGPAPFYGHGVVRLKPERIENRVRFFEGDSLTQKDNAGKVNPNWLIRKWDDAQSRTLDHQGAILSRALMELELKEADATHAHTMYVEAHIAGGVTLEDIGSISYGVVDRSKERSELEDVVESSDPSYQAHGKFRLEELEKREAEKQEALRNLQMAAEEKGIPFEIRELGAEIRPVEAPDKPGGFRRQLAADEAYGNKVPKRPKLTAGITPQKIERMQWLLTYPDFNPADLISFMEAQLPIGAEFKRDVGVFEGYDLGQHTIMMMKQFEKYGLSHELGDVVENPDFLPFFRLFLSLHDIGKPRAVAAGNKDDQHKYTFEIMADVLPQLGVKPEMVKLAQALIMDDPLGKLIRGKISESEAAEIVIKMAGYSGLSIKQFYPILRVFYKVDAASYTADAGGIASLDGMFQFGPGYLEFNSQIAEQLRSLRARINIITMPAVLPLMREHSGYVFNSIYTSEFARHCLSPDEFNKFEFYVAGQVTEADLIGSVNINKLAQVVVELGQQIEQNIKAVKAELAGFRKHFSENPEDLAEYAATFAPDGNDVMLAYVRGEIDEALVMAEIDLSNYDVAAEIRKNVPLFSKAETVRVFIKLQNQVRSVESSQLGQDEKRSELELIEESKQILRDRCFGSEIHHGTSSLAWRGITSSGGKILSAAESQRRKINIATGERDIAGGSANHDVIYTGYHVDGYGTAEGYANLNTRSDGYRNPSTYTEVELSSRISAYSKAIDSLERQKLDKLPGLKVGGDLHTLKRELAGFEEALKMKQTVDVYADTAKPYPVVFGLKVDGLNIDAARTRDWGGFLSGEARVHEPAISLVKNCDKIFVPREFMEAARKSLIEAVGQEAAEKIKIYSFEAMENAASPSMDKIVGSSYRNTFNDLDWQQTNRLNQIYIFANNP